VQEERITVLTQELVVARTEIEHLSNQQYHQAESPARPSGTPTTTPAEKTKAPVATNLPGTELRDALNTIILLQQSVTRLEGQLADAHAELQSWERAMNKPEELDVARSGNAAHDRTVSMLTARMEQYSRSWRQAQGRLSATDQKQHVLAPSATGFECCARQNAPELSVHANLGTGSNWCSFGWERPGRPMTRNIPATGVHLTSCQGSKPCGIGRARLQV
jgi:hypothetical protein